MVLNIIMRFIKIGQGLLNGYKSENMTNGLNLSVISRFNMIKTGGMVDDFYSNL